MHNYSSQAVLNRDQWQLLVDILDGDYDQHKLETAQDVLTRVAPHLWLEEAEVVDEARRMLIRQARGELDE